MEHIGVPFYNLGGAWPNNDKQNWKYLELEFIAANLPDQNNLGLITNY